MTISPNLNGAEIDFAAGSLIFQQGDPGGDLYLLRSGEVEVFRSTGTVEVRLATLRQGEILGIMTCLTREPRLASARALSDVKALVVKQAGFKTLISSTPAWVHTVIKDYILRIKAMNDLYTKTVEGVEKADRDVSTIWVASALAAGLGEIGSMLVPREGGPHLVDVDKAMERLARIIDTPLGRLEEVFQIFVAVGLLKADPGAAERRAELPVLQKLAGFTEFARGYLSQPDVRAALTALTAKDSAALIALHESVKSNAKAAEPVRLPAADPELALRASAARLVELDAEGGTISFVPQLLINGVRYLLVIQKCRALSPRKGGFETPDRQAIQVITENF